MGAGADHGLFGSWWAPSLAWYLFLLVGVVFGWVALFLVMAGVLAVPG